MRSPFGALASAIGNKAPIPYVGRSVPSFYQGPGAAGAAGAEAQMRQFGAVGTLHAIVSRLAEATSQVDWHLYRSAKSGKDDDRVEVTSHLALDIWNNPNPYYTRQEFVETFQQHYELVGESAWVVGRNEVMRNIPLELWPVRPDRIAPVPDRDNFIAGYKYRGPDGELVPLDLDEVICLRRPNPLDPYRGMGAVQSILVDIDASRYTKEWNRNFFLNSAEPGGIIEIEERLDDDEWQEMRTRWAEQHRGVAQAHRVAILEQGKWVERKFNQKDMQFVELSNLSRENIREAFTFPKPLLGTVEDVNRANADAAEVVLARWLIVPRLERIKGILNNDFLRLFGVTGQGVEFDYDNPVPDDDEAQDRERTSKATAAKVYVEAGFTAESIKLALDLPASLEWKEPPPPPAPMIQPPAPDPGVPIPATPAPEAAPAAYYWGYRPQGAAPGPAPEVDLSAVQAAWERALERLMLQWPEVLDVQRAALVRQVRTIIESGDLSALAGMTVPTDKGAQLLLAAMAALAEDAAAHVVIEARAQGVEIHPAVPASGTLRETAELASAMLGAELALQAAREAARVHSPGAAAGEVADAVGTALRQLSDAGPRTAAGGALTGAQNAARIETFKRGPIAALYSDETLDKNTCGPCRAINGRWLGNSTNGTDMEQIEKTYPTSGYVDCLGRSRCRGTITGVWRSKMAGE